MCPWGFDDLVLQRASGLLGRSCGVGAVRCSHEYCGKPSDAPPRGALGGVFEAKGVAYNTSKHNIKRNG